jgi:alpha-beta hydrolase superfamily lysophospholipase
MVPALTAERATEPVSMTFPADDGTTVSAMVWRASDARGVLVVAHGVGEHAGCYDHLARAVRDVAPVEVVAFDFRGHGRSPGRRGVVRRYDDLLADLRGVLRGVAERWPGAPIFLLGHSNGGQVAARVAAHPPVPLAGLILCNPVVGLSIAPPRWKIVLGRILQRIAPGLTLPTGLGDEQMTSDPAMVAARRGDHLRHDRIGPALFFGMVDGREATLNAAEALRLPVLLLLGERDPVIDLGLARLFFERVSSPDRKLLSLSEMRHEPFNERGREVPFGALADWLRAHLPARVATAAPTQADRSGR